MELLDDASVSIELNILGNIVFYESILEIYDILANREFNTTINGIRIPTGKHDKRLIIFIIKESRMNTKAFQLLKQTKDRALLKLKNPRLVFKIANDFFLNAVMFENRIKRKAIDLSMILAKIDVFVFGKKPRTPYSNAGVKLHIHNKAMKNERKIIIVTHLNENLRLFKLRHIQLSVPFQTKRDRETARVK